MRFAPMVRKRMVGSAADEKTEVWEIARVFGAGESGVRRVLQRHRERGTHLPRPPHPGREPRLADDVAARVRSFVATHADATRRQIKEAAGLAVGPQAVGRRPRRPGPVLKKSRPSPASRTAPTSRPAATSGTNGPRGVDPDTVVFVDESAARTDMTRTHGRVAKGERVAGKVPNGHRHTTTVLSGVRTAGPLAGARSAGPPTPTAAAPSAAAATLLREKTRCSSSLAVSQSSENAVSGIACPSGGRMTVRPATPADADVVADIYRFYVTDTAVTFDEVPPTAGAFARRIGDGGLPWVVAVSGGQVVGYAAAAPHGTRASFRWSVNAAVYVRRGHARSGVGRALYGELLPRLTAMHFVRVYAAITLPNVPSVGLHEALGFRPVATFPAAGFKLGRWWDVGWWERPLVPLPDRPVEPLAGPAVP